MENKLVLTAKMNKLIDTIKYMQTVLEYAISEINRYPYIGKSVTQICSAISLAKETLENIDKD